MRKMLLSFKPEVYEKIKSGKKIFEHRRNFPDEPIMAYMAKDAKRVSSKPTETDNDKYAFRCFLLRLGFIGNEYKTARKILLRNLTGNSAFRYEK